MGNKQTVSYVQNSSSHTVAVCFALCIALFRDGPITLASRPDGIVLKVGLLGELQRFSCLKPE